MISTRIRRSSVLAGLAMACLSQAALAQPAGAIDPVVAAQARVAAYRAEVEQLKESVATQAAAIRRLDQRVVDLKAELAQQEQLANNLRSELSEREQSLQQSADRLNRCATQTAAVQNELQQAQAQAARHAQAYQTLERQADEQAQTLLQANQSLESARAELDGCASESRALASQQQSLRDSLKGCLADASEQQQQLLTLHRRADEHQHAAQELRQQLREQSGAARRNIEGLKAQLAHVTERNRVLQVTVSDFQSRGPGSQSSPSEDAAALREALARANDAIQKNNQRYKSELQAERTLHARSEALLRQQCEQGSLRPASN